MNQNKISNINPSFVFHLALMDSKSKQDRFNDLYNEWAEPIYRYIYFYLGQKEASEDITQEVFVKFWNKMISVESGKEKAYLYTSAKNLIINQARHSKVVLKFEAQNKLETTSNSPHFELEEKEFKIKLEQGINDLPESQREVFLMHRIEGLKYKEIADRLSLGQKAVEKRMHLALKKLREIYDKI